MLRSNIIVRFLYARLIMASLYTKPTIDAVRAALENMPKDLQELFNDVCVKILAQNEAETDLAKRVLLWISRANWPFDYFRASTRSSS